MRQLPNYTKVKQEFHPHPPVFGSMLLWPVCPGPSDWSVCTWPSRHSRGRAWWACTCGLADHDRARPREWEGQRRGGRAEMCTVTSPCPGRCAQRWPPCPDRLQKAGMEKSDFKGLLWHSSNREKTTTAAKAGEVYYHKTREENKNATTTGENCESWVLTK